MLAMDYEIDEERDEVMQILGWNHKNGFGGFNTKDVFENAETPK